MIERVTCTYCGFDCKIYWQETAVWHCLNCDLLFRYPQPDDDHIRAHYEMGWRDPDRQIISGATDLTLAELYVNRLLNELDIPDFQQTHLLEFGAGTGEMLTTITQKGAEVIAIEPFGFDYLLQNGVTVFADLTTLPKMKFDGIYSVQVLEHLPKPWELLQDLYHYLKPGGWLYISTIYAQSLNARLTRGNWREAKNVAHLNFFTTTSLELFLKNAGYGGIRRVTAPISYPHKKGIVCQLDQAIQKLNLGGELCYMAWRPKINK